MIKERTIYNTNESLEARIDQAIEKSEEAVANGVKPLTLKEAKKKLDKKYYGL